MSYLELREANIARNEEFLERLGFKSAKLQRVAASGSPTGTGPTGTRQSKAQAAQTATVPSSRRAKAADAGREESADCLVAVDAQEQHERLQGVLCRFPHRETEVRTICGYLNELFAAAPALYVSGAAGSGKTDICRSLAEVQAAPHAYLLCTGYSSARQLVRSLWGAVVAACFAGNSSSSSSSSHSTAEELLEKPPGSFADLAAALRALMAAHKRLATVNLVLDRVDAADALEARLSHRLLRLSEFGHPGLKVLAVAARPPIVSRNCLMLLLPPYDMQQLEGLLLARLRAEAEDAGSAQQLRTLPILPAALRAALPYLSSVTVHVGELLAALRGVVATVQQRGAEAEAVGDMAVDAAKEIVRLPSANMQRPTGAGATGGGGAGRRSFSTAAPHSRFSDPDELPLGWTSLGALAEVVEPASLRSRNSCSELAKSRKYLLVAAYLASRNPKESDSTVFAMAKKSRRKKVQLGRAGDEAEKKEEAKGLRPFSLERLLSIFSQISIIGETSALGAKKRRLNNAGPEARSSYDVAATVERQFGDAQLFAAVNDLEAQRYLVRAPSWTLESPAYFGFVQGELATELAALLSFDLPTYLHTSRSEN